MRHILNEDAKLDSMRRAIVDNGFTDATVDAIIAMDSQSRGGGAGQVAKSLLLPKFIEGETDFINHAQDVAAAINTYYANRGSYPNEAKNVGNFASVAQFIQFVADPSSVSFGGAPSAQKSKIDQIYEKNYSAIPRDVFNAIIALDPATSTDMIGPLARTFYLPHAMNKASGANGEIDFTNEQQTAALIDAMDWFNKNQQNLSDEERDLNTFATTQEFLDFVDSKKNSHFKQVTDIFNFIHSEELRDFEGLGSGVEFGIDLPDCGLTLLAETPNWLVWWPKSRLAGCLMSNGGWDNSQGRQQDWWSNCSLYREGTIGQHWCTTSIATTGWFPGYSDPYHEDENDYKNLVISFINKNYCYPRDQDDRKKSVQVALTRYNTTDTFQVSNSSTFLDGNDGTPSYGSYHDGLKALFAQNPELIDALKDVFPFNQCEELFELTKYRKEEIVINSWVDFQDIYHMQNIKSQAFVKTITIGPEIKRIPAGIFAGTSIKSIRIPGTVESIEPGAFSGCTSLTDLVIMEGVKIIDKGAFFGCSGLNGKAVLLPNSLQLIGKHAFGETDCKIKIKSSRLDIGDNIVIDPSDKQWFNNHVSVVDVR